MSYHYVDLFGNGVREWVIPEQEYRKRPQDFKTANMKRKAAMFSSERQDWQTPLWFYELLCRERDIKEYDTDPATNKDNPLNCKTFYTIEDDGLSKKWYGNVFINPPFGWGYYRSKWTYFTGLWLQHAWRTVNLFGDPVKIVTVIVPASVSTQVFHKYIWDYDKARARKGVRVNFYPKRIRFKGSKMVAPFNTMIVDFGRE